MLSLQHLFCFNFENHVLIGQHFYSGRGLKFSSQFKNGPLLPIPISIQPNTFWHSESTFNLNFCMNWNTCCDTKWILDFKCQERSQQWWTAGDWLRNTIEWCVLNLFNCWFNEVNPATTCILTMAWTLHRC